MTASIVRGWCPGAHRPMLSGDGLVVRVRPFKAQVTGEQVIRLCDLADAFGNGLIDLTSRANLQIRGVAEADHPALLVALDQLGLIDSDPAVEGHRNILMPPDWEPGDLTDRLYDALLTCLPRLPALPEKMGFALDTSNTGQLQDGSADFRFERSATGSLILRADGATAGRAVSESTTISALQEMAEWFVASNGPPAGRMARHLKAARLPKDWRKETPRPASGVYLPGPVTGGMVLGVPFGKISTGSLRALVDGHPDTILRLMIGRRIMVHPPPAAQTPGFVTTPRDPRMRAHTCPGAPFCPQSQADTQTLANRLARSLPANVTLHVSGCAKGCAHPRRASHTLVGRDGGFDLVLNGTPWDEPSSTGLAPDSLATFKDLT